MKTVNNRRFAMLLAANMVLACVLSLYQTSTAAPPKPVEPFANSVEQRAEMIAELKLINAQLKEQNELLRSGALKVTLAERDKR